MDGYNIYPDPALRGKIPWPLIASSLWLRLGFVAATGVIVALTELYKGEAGLLGALAWIFGGTWLAAYSWRRALHLIERLNGAQTVSGTTASDTTLPKAATHASWDRRDVVAPPVARQVRG